MYTEGRINLLRPGEWLVGAGERFRDNIPIDESEER
jgi:hypothetical protein